MTDVNETSETTVPGSTTTASTAASNDSTANASSSGVDESTDTAEDSTTVGATTETDTTGPGSTESSTTDTDEPTRVHVFRGPMTNGNVLALGPLPSARANADSHCYNTPLYPIECSQAHAFASFNDNDELRDMVAVYGIPPSLPVVGPNDTLIDDNFQAMFDGSLQNSLTDSGVFAELENFWTGSNADGSATEINCDGWSSSESGDYGAVGNGSQTTNWTWSQSGSCAGMMYLVCVCW